MITLYAWRFGPKNKPKAGFAMFHITWKPARKMCPMQMIWNRHINQSWREARTRYRNVNIWDCVWSYRERRVYPSESWLIRLLLFLCKLFVSLAANSDQLQAMLACQGPWKTFFMLRWVLLFERNKRKRKKVWWVWFTFFLLVCLEFLRFGALRTTFKVEEHWEWIKHGFWGIASIIDRNLKAFV